MGFFGTFTYSDGQWGTSPKGDMFLRVDIHDSDIATVDFAPTSQGRGRFYLGLQPRDYFDDPSASGPVDNDAEARALADWAAQLLGSQVTADDIRPLLADDGVEEPDEPFVEAAVKKLILTIGLPLPEELTAG
jgi:hypothetical protein